MRAATAAGLLATAAAFIVPATALGAEARVDGTTLVYTGNPGRDQIRLNGTAGPAFFQINDNGVATVSGGPCVRQDSAILCPVDQVKAARFDLGDGDDELLVSGADEGSTTTELPLTINGGAGNDVLSGAELDDVIDGGPGNDDIPAHAGNDTVTGGEGDDSLRGNDGNDTLDGGPGDDFLNGMEGNDFLKPGTGRDDVRGGDGDDTVDMRNGERDTGEAVCEGGSADTILLDPADQVLEYRSGANLWTVEPSCEKVSGQAAPKPTQIFLTPSGRGPQVTVDLVEALPATIGVQVLLRGRVVARGSVKRKATRTNVRLGRVGARSKVKRGKIYRVTVRVTVKDSGGRKSVATKKLLIAFV